MIRVLHLEPNTIGPYVAGLRALERDITYPLAGGDDAFWIDHGAEYHPFFSGLGEAHFLVALDKDRVVGSVAGILRRATANGVSFTSGYACDYKVAPSHRGSGVAMRMLFSGLREILNPFNPARYRSFQYIYGAAMRGAKGDVSRSARGAHPLKLIRPIGRLAIYFVSPQRLAALDTSDPPASPEPGGLDFSPDIESAAEPPGVVSTAGRKDLRLESSGQSWPLAHLPLGPSAWRPNLPAYLRRAGETLVGKNAGGDACFALDERLAATIAWLRQRDIAPGATATVLAGKNPIAPRGPSIQPLSNFPWIHLATSEI